jgi:hypothetical protein
MNVTVIFSAICKQCGVSSAYSIKFRMNIRDRLPEPFYMVIVRYLKGHTNYIRAMATNLKPLRKYKGYTDVVYDKINNIIYGIIYIMFYDAYRIGYGYISLLS